MSLLNRSALLFCGIAATAACGSAEGRDAILLDEFTQ